MSAIGYRGAILSSGRQFRDGRDLHAGLRACAAVRVAYRRLALRDRAVLTAIARAWRRSLLAGFMGAIASQFWFLAFALASAASVRTLALVEVLFAQAISAFIFAADQQREVAGWRRRGRRRLVVLVGALVLLIWAY